MPMLNEKQLRALLQSSENHWVERKKSFHRSIVKEAIVGFANAVPEDQHAVLFIGAGPDGRYYQVENIDKIQRDIRNIALEECFPKIQCTPTTLQADDVEIIAVVVEFSKDRPHFAGHAFVRVGSETVKASQRLFEELVASRNDKARRILREKGKVVSVVSFDPSPIRVHISGSSRLAKRLSSQSRPEEHYRECRVEDCDTFVLRYMDITLGENFAVPLEKVKISYDTSRSRLQLNVDRT